jgi:hypothetical protein
MAKKQLHFAKTEIDGRCIDMLLTEDEIIKASKRALNPTNSKFMPEVLNTCWPIEHPPKCSFWDRLLGNCECKKEN